MKTKVRYLNSMFWSVLLSLSQLPHQEVMFLTLVLVLLTSFLPIHAHPQHHDIVTRSSSGCGKKPFVPDVVRLRFVKSSGKYRSYFFHLSSSYDVNKPYPMVLGFHGSSSIGAFLEADSKMNQADYSGEKIMIYPNGAGGSWAGPTYHKDSTVAEDVQFVKDVIEDVKGNMCVDEDKVFGVG
jgi:poly(3-hydroxybutyrate) depolymerase